MSVGVRSGDRYAVSGADDEPWNGAPTAFAGLNVDDIPEDERSFAEIGVEILDSKIRDYAHASQSVPIAN